MEPIDEVECVACGAALVPETSRAYAIGEEAFLCYACALSRGGAWDELHDRWMRPPRIGDLQEEVRPQV